MLEAPTKTCSRCKQALSPDSFDPCSTKSPKLRSHCRDCYRAYHREWQQRPEVRERRRKRRETQGFKDHVRAYDLRTKYDLAVEDYEKMLAEQAGQCAICGAAKQLVVDHCHATGAVRGLLCSSCNRGIGLLGDDPDRLRTAANYLQLFKG